MLCMKTNLLFPLLICTVLPGSLQASTKLDGGVAICGSDTVEIAFPVNGIIEDKDMPTFVAGDFECEVQSWDTTLVSVSLSPEFYLHSGSAKKSGRTLTIPAKVIHGGVEYRVYNVGNFNDCPGAETIIVEEGIENIGRQAFAGCKSLERIMLPASLLNIGSGIFAGCNSLNSIVIEKSNAQYVSPKGSNAVVDRTASVLVAGCNSTVIPHDVKTIGRGAFYGCTGLTELVIPEVVEVIQDGAFEDCVNLKLLSLPESLRSIGNFAFSGCASLDSLFVPAGLTAIHGGGNAFAGCTALKSIRVAPGNKTFDSRGNCNAIIETASNALRVGCATTVIPETVERLCSECFSGSGLMSVSIPASVDSIEMSAFKDCRRLVKMAVASGNKVYDSRSGCNAIVETRTDKLIAGCNSTCIPADIKHIGPYAMAGMLTPSSLILPEGLETISRNAFSGCDYLEYVSIPNSVTTMGNGAFSDCIRLRSVDLNAQMGIVPDLTFAGCVALEHVTINNNATGVGYCAFQGCNRLSRLVLPQTITRIDRDAFKGCLLEPYIHL